MSVFSNSVDFVMIWFGLVVKEGGGYEQVAEPRMLRYT